MDGTVFMPIRYKLLGSEKGHLPKNRHQRRFFCQEINLTNVKYFFFVTEVTLSESRLEVPKLVK